MYPYPISLPQQELGIFLQVLSGAKQIFDDDADQATWVLLGYGRSQLKLGNHSTTPVAADPASVHAHLLSAMGPNHAALIGGGGLIGSVLQGIAKNINWATVIQLILKLATSGAIGAVAAGS